MLQALAGHDPRDPASASRPIPDYTALLGQRQSRGSRSGVIHHFHETDQQGQRGHFNGASGAAIATFRDSRPPKIREGAAFTVCRTGTGVRLADLDYRARRGL